MHSTRAAMIPWHNLPRTGHVTADDASTILGVSKGQIRFLIWQGTLERTGYAPMVGGGQQGMVSVASIELLLDEIRSGIRHVRPRARNTWSMA